jgi:hypothetical protein
VRVSWAVHSPRSELVAERIKLELHFHNALDQQLLRDRRFAPQVLHQRGRQIACSSTSMCPSIEAIEAPEIVPVQDPRVWVHRPAIAHLQNPH